MSQNIARQHEAVMAAARAIVHAERARLHWWGRLSYPRWYVRALRDDLARRQRAWNDACADEYKAAWLTSYGDGEKR